MSAGRAFTSAAVVGTLILIVLAAVWISFKRTYCCVIASDDHVPITVVSGSAPTSLAVVGTEIMVEVCLVSCEILQLSVSLDNLFPLPNCLLQV